MKSMLCEHRRLKLLAAFAAGAITVPALPASAAPISVAEFDDLAAKCASMVPSDTLAAVARIESGVDPWVLHDNTSETSIRPASLSAAATDAAHLASMGHSVDIGLMQINSANLSALGISSTDALDPCVSLTAGAAVLKAAYGDGNGSPDQKVALLLALSRYNTGTPFKGIMNGYARAVEQNGAQGWPTSSPAINLAAQSVIPTVAAATAAAATAVDPNVPPAWDLWASAAYERLHGASWLVTSNADPGQR